MSTTTPPSPIESLTMLLRALKLPTFSRHASEVAQTAERQGWSFGQYLHHLCELEVEERRQKRLERYLKASDLPREKTLATLDRGKLPTKVQRLLPVLCEGAFVERGENLLCFGLPGRGKTHVVSAIGFALVQRGYRVLFTPTYALVQRLLSAKRDLRLEKELGTLDSFDAVILDDIGYVQQSREEMEVLFTFLAERYERRSVLLTSNLVFSEWDRIFKDPMTTAAAIDRLVHHAIILEMTGPSQRNEAAKKRGQPTNTTSAAAATDGATTTTTTTTTTEATTTTTDPTATTNPRATEAATTEFRTEGTERGSQGGGRNPRTEEVKRRGQTTRETTDKDRTMTRDATTTTDAITATETRTAEATTTTETKGQRTPLNQEGDAQM